MATFVSTSSFRVTKSFSKASNPTRRRTLADAVERAVDATNQACAEGPPEPTREDAPKAEADAIARTVGERQRFGHPDRPA